MKTSFAKTLAMIAIWAGTSAQAEQVDVICAVEQIIACEAFQPCERSLPGAVNMPALIKIDHTNGVVLARTASGGDRTSKIATTEDLDVGYVITGVDDGNGWSFRVADDNGRFTFASAHNGVAFSGFGVCASE